MINQARGLFSCQPQPVLTITKKRFGRGWFQCNEQCTNPVRSRSEDGKFPPRVNSPRVGNCSLTLPRVSIGRLHEWGKLFVLTTRPYRTIIPVTSQYFPSTPRLLCEFTCFATTAKLVLLYTDTFLKTTQSSDSQFVSKSP